MSSEVEESFSEMIIEAVNNYSEENNNISPDIVIFTGDFTNSGETSEFENAKTEMQKIIKGIPSIKNCLIVPGNHDYRWYENGKKVKPDKRDTSYKYFKQSCESEGICSKQKNKPNKPLAEKLDKYLITHLYLEDKDFALLIIGMNSDMIDSEERAGQGFFNKEQHSICKNLIKYYKKINSENNRKLITISAFHHHILPVSSVERDTLKNPDKISLTLDARRTLDFFMENEVSLAVHGHQHQPSIVYWKDEMKDSSRGIYVISAGSMSQNKADLGDISKNSFMIYDINKNETTVYCFQNSNSDWDMMELSRNPYKFSFVEPYSEIKCNIIENSSPPQGLELLEYDESRDASDLFYLFLNVVDCDLARKEIYNYYNRSKESYDNLELCGIHNLYGKFDILLKYRSNNDIRFSDELQKHLIDKNIITLKSTSYFVNIAYENIYFKEIHKIPLIKSPEAYLNSTWNVATLTVYLERKMNPDIFFSELKQSIDLFNTKNNTKIEDIIRSYAIGQDRSVIFELFISCYQFPMLTRFTNLIEDIIRPDGIDKSTHIIYYFDERHI